MCKLVQRTNTPRPQDIFHQSARRSFAALGWVIVLQEGATQSVKPTMDVNVWFILTFRSTGHGERATIGGWHICHMFGFSDLKRCLTIPETIEIKIKMNSTYTFLIGC